MKSSLRFVLAGSITALVLLRPAGSEISLPGQPWLCYAGDPQHTALSAVAAQPLTRIHWKTPVDRAPRYSGDALLIHYGSPLVTRANTVIVPVKTGPFGGFTVEGRRGATGERLWSIDSDYVLPPHDWVPSWGLALSRGFSPRLWVPGAGGTVFEVGSPDSSAARIVGQRTFYGQANYAADPDAYRASVFINTPITADRDGNLFFGFQVTGATPLGLRSGIARISAAGVGSTIAASDAAGDATIRKVSHNCAPALSTDGKTLYVAVSDGSGRGFAHGYLVALDSQTLATRARVRLKDAAYPANDAYLPEAGSASPTIGPDGDVYFGVLENPFPSHADRGWLLHFAADLTPKGYPGSFGWDDTASIVPIRAVRGYKGRSKYLVMTKYNFYAGIGGDGVNRLAILDPNAAQADATLGIPVMKEVRTIAGPTPDEEHVDGYPNAVREWCINTAAVDPWTRSVLVNSEDGKLYRWDLDTNSLSQTVVLTEGIGEAYTPTLVGPDGTVYAINNGTLFAVGQ
jgi:hypothetical protein